MPAVNGKNTMICEFETGVISDRRIHVIKMEIPPSTMKIGRQKNVQKLITTKGHSHNHALEALPVLTFAGQAYHPPNAADEGFNPNSAWAGLEGLNSSYVASGRLSSSPDLVNTIKSNFLYAPPAVSNANVFSDFLQTVQERVGALAAIQRKLLPFGTMQSTGEFTFNTDFLVRQLNITEINSIKNLSLSELERDASIVAATKEQFRSAVANLNPDNASATYAQLNQLAQSEPKLNDSFSKFEYFYNKYINENSQLAISGLDPTTTTYMTRDPFAMIKADAGKKIVTSLTTSQESIRRVIRGQENQGSQDWIITIVLYIKDMVFVGHWENFNISESAQNPNFYNWDAVFVAHQSFVLKNNNVIPFDRAFDTSLTQINFTSNIFQSRDRFDILDYILNLSTQSPLPPITQNPNRIEINSNPGRIEIDSIPGGGNTV